jgi:hypothetical protein
LPKDGDFTAEPDNDKTNENYLSHIDTPVKITGFGFFVLE